MIDVRRLYLALLLSAIGWQLVSGMNSEPAPAALLLVIAGIIAATFCLPRDVRIAAAIALFAVQLSALPAVVALLARWHRMPGLASAIAAAARLAGADAASVAGRVVIQTGGPIVDYLPNLARLGAAPLMMIVAGLIGVVLVVPRPYAGRLFARCTAVLVLFAFARMLLVILARIDLPDHGFDTSAWTMLLTLAPAALFMPRAVEVSAVARRHAIAPAALAATAAAAWIVAFGFIDLGSAQRGRVLFDDSHGPWEPVATPFGPADFGQKLSYAYSSFFQLLHWHYDVERWASGPLTDAVLANRDVLIVKTPTQPFTDAEVSAVERFVRAGGGLMLIGDHTNLFGMTTHLNKLARPFGLAFVRDDTFALPNEAQSHWREPSWLSHPVAADIRRFEFETSCTLDVPLTARAPMIGYGLGADPADYSRPGFFGNIHLDDKDDFGFFVQHAVLDYKRGRVAVLSDSTPLSNFSVFFPGRRELALSTVEFLNHRPTAARYVPFIAFLIACAALLIMLGGRQLTAPLPTACALAAGMVAGSLIALPTSRPLPVPPIRQAVHTVSFDRSLCDPVLPSVLSMDEHDNATAIDTFFVAAQRLGYLPAVADDVPPRLGRGDAIVLMSPERMPDRAHLTALMRFVSRGGSLLIVDGLLQHHDATAAVAQAFGFGIVPLPQHVPLKTADGVALTAARPVLTVAGGTPLLRDNEDRVLFADLPFEQGHVSLLVDAMALSKGELGSRFTSEPTPEQRKGLDLAYYILRRVVEPAVTAAKPKLAGAG